METCLGTHAERDQGTGDNSPAISVVNATEAQEGPLPKDGGEGATLMSRRLLLSCSHFFLCSLFGNNCA